MSYPKSALGVQYRATCGRGSLGSSGAFILGKVLKGTNNLQTVPIAPDIQLGRWFPCQIWILIETMDRVTQLAPSLAR